MAYQKLLFLGIALAAFVGNCLTVILFIKKSKWLKKAYNCLILALAIQDILLAICLVVLPGFVMEQDAYTLPSNESSRFMYCKILWSHFIPFSLGIASVYTCLMLTFDRWLAVVKPLSYKAFEQSKIVIFFTILFPWIAGICFEITSPLNTTFMEVNGTVFCAWKKREFTSKTIFLAVFTFLGMIVIPAGLMVLAYFRIVFHIKRSQNRISAINDSSVIDKKSNGTFRSLKRVTVAAFLASTVVIVCWFPDQLYYTLSQVNLTQLGTTAHFVVKVLAFASSCVNPLIYCFSNNAYKNGLKEMFACLYCKTLPLPTEFSTVEHITSRPI